jgi:3-methyladenine DNA glycosylase/8-oxoguanine DNA glycosylase
MPDRPSISAKQRRERLKAAPKLAPETLERLHKQHPTAHCELDHRSPFELLVSVVLSAQTTDVGVNKATPKLFARYPDATALAGADPKDVEPYVAALGFFRMKSKAIVGLSRALVEHAGRSRGRHARHARQPAPRMDQEHGRREDRARLVRHPAARALGHRQSHSHLPRSPLLLRAQARLPELHCQ